MFDSCVLDDLNRSGHRASGAFGGHSDGCFPAFGACGREYFQEGFHSCLGDVAAASDEDGEIVHSVEAGVATFAGKCHGNSNILLKFVEVRVAEVFLGFEGACNLEDNKRE